MMTNRIGRLEFLFWFAVSIVATGIALAIVSVLTNTPIEPGRTQYPLPVGLVIIALLAVVLKAHVSRFHDLGWSGSAAVVVFIPLVDVAAILLLAVVPGQKGANRFGEPQKFLQRFRTVEKPTANIPQ